MLPNCSEFQSQNVQTYGYAFHDTNGQHHGQTLNIQWFLSNEICIVTHLMASCRNDSLREVLLGLGWEKVPNWECLFVHRKTRFILFGIRGWHQNGGKETECGTHVESTQQRSRFGRTNIFPWSCVPGRYSDTMWNKHRYCWQLQNHVWIQNFCGWSRETAILSKSSYFFMVLCYGGSCKEVCGTKPNEANIEKHTKMLESRISSGATENYQDGKYLTQRRLRATTWKDKLKNALSDTVNRQTRKCSSYTKSQVLAWMIPNSRKKSLKHVGELSEENTQIILKCLYLARICRPDILWSVNKLVRAVTQWTQACYRRFGKNDFIYPSRKWLPAMLRCGQHGSTLSIGFIPRLRFCWWRWRLKINFRVNHVFSEAEHLSPSFGCARSKRQYPTVLQNLKLSR